MKLSYKFITLVLLSGYAGIFAAQDLQQQKVNDQDTSDKAQAIEKQSEDHVGKAIGRLHAILKMHRRAHCP